MSDKYLKNKDYTIRGGKEAQISNNRQRMAMNQHSQADAFVKAEQAKDKKHWGKAPVMEERYYKFDACMMNNGAHAQKFAKQASAGLDKEAFPVRQNVDEMQD